MVRYLRKSEFLLRERGTHTVHRIVYQVTDDENIENKEESTMEITLIKSPGNFKDSTVNIREKVQQLSEKAAHILIAELYRADCITFIGPSHFLLTPDG